MTNVPKQRRRFLQQLIAVLPAGGACAVSSTISIAGGPGGGAPNLRDEYKPSYFTPDEWIYLHAAVDRLIPTDTHGPGALAAGVPEYIDRQMNTPYAFGKLWYMQGPFHVDLPAEFGFQMNLSPRDIYRLGIAECNRHCQRHYGEKIFAHLSRHAQDDVLKQMEQAKIMFDEVPARTFFAFLLEHTKEGFFADPKYGGNKDMVGWKTVGFPGARADFADWIDQPDTKYPYGPVSIDGRRG
ncbi:gluconate 2-dehydrogenase [Burkholderia diffusa]|uniref:Gluconate 2-dehydrogenase n=1 Tax=Burkholderia diffusa TaxID=488732 RepID=A0AAW3PBA2_9BURK|nr:gluconate 2-dehydrogenase subunit 3 family protein [Burkholderia diffusa]KWF32779.1 gluconate 2-dehydrogenase [Burkholderia diffusa]KWF38701.1 gluconate 2-dehydrogenase [Burkholderia diffusa]KWF46746.1 gluconate 2-dehydrogenase [Burkholderia diffusa]KWF50683.1 gluconate 2-dehydrogenase [Burkholderia diffusa]